MTTPEENSAANDFACTVFHFLLPHSLVRYALCTKFGFRRARLADRFLPSTQSAWSTCAARVRCPACSVCPQSLSLQGCLDKYVWFAKCVFLPTVPTHSRRRSCTLHAEEEDALERKRPPVHRKHCQSLKT